MPSSLSVERKVTFPRHCSACGHVWFYKKTFFRMDMDSYIESDESIYRKMEKEINNEVDTVLTSPVTKEIVCPKCSNLAVETLNTLFSSGYKLVIRQVWVEGLKGIPISWGFPLVLFVFSVVLTFIFLPEDILTILSLEYSAYRDYLIYDLDLYDYNLTYNFSLEFYLFSFISIILAIWFISSVLFSIKVRRNTADFLSWIDSINEQEARSVALEIIKKRYGSWCPTFSDLLSVYRQKNR